MNSKENSVSPARLAAWTRLVKLRRSTEAKPAELEPGETGEISRPADRREAAQADRLVRGILRRVSLLDALLERPGMYQPARTPAELQWILRIAAYETVFQTGTPDYAIGEQSVALARRTAGERGAKFVNAMVRRLLPTLPRSEVALAAEPMLGTLPKSQRWSVPEPIINALAEGYGSDFETILPAMSESEASVWLRVNALKTTPVDAAQALSDEKVDVESFEAIPEAFRWTGGEMLPWNTEIWKRGELTVQDLGAMLAARLLDPRPGQRVLDLCAAPGGKTGHLWERMKGEGRLVAAEIDPRRRAEMSKAMARLYGTHHGIEIPEIAAVENAGPALGFDRVLLDAPCLALGLIGRHPEIRWDGRLRHLSAMTQTQGGLLEAGGALTAPGGKLLWVTCSPTPAENEGVISAWLAKNPDWSILDPAGILGPSLSALISLRNGFVRTRPDLAPCDGFAMALLERRKAS